MFCPNCKKEELKEVNFYNNKVDRCPKCLGLWFEEDKLRKSKDKKDENIRWLDINLFDETIKDLDIKESTKISPKCGIPLYEVNYFKNDKENVEVDICRKCHGIWLDKDEFEKIIEKLKKMGDYDILKNYSKILLRETKEVISGDYGFKSEILDVFIILKLFKYKFFVKHQDLTNLIFKITSFLPK